MRQYAYGKATRGVVVLVLALQVFVVGRQSFASGCLEKSTQFHTRVDRTTVATTVFEFDGLNSKTSKFALKDLFGSENEIILGYDYHYGHMYLNVGGTRFDPRLPPFRGEFNRAGKVNRGILIRVQNPSPESVKKFKDYVEKKGTKRTLTCAHGACQFLAKGAGIRLADRRNPQLFPYRVLESILEQGFVDQVGKPVVVEIWKTETRSLRKVIKEGRKSDLQTVVIFSIIYTQGVAVAGAVAGFVGFVMLYNDLWPVAR